MRNYLLIWLLAALALAACNDSGGAESACVYHSDCAAHEICAAGQCLPECREDRDCDDGECDAGVCRGSDFTPDAGPDDAGEPGDTAQNPDTDDPDGSGADGPDTTDEPDFGPRPDGVGRVTGQVHFRLHDGTILPVSQPIVYWTPPETPPVPLPATATCECGYPEDAVRGNVDGTFTLRDVAAGPVWLVIQKGNFRRRRLVTVQPDASVPADVEATELPTRSDPEAGDEIPRIAIGTGRFDSVEDIFAKLRMAPIAPNWTTDYDAFLADPGAYGIELLLYQTPRTLDDDDRELDAPPFAGLLYDRARLRDFHFVFAPCAEYRTYAELLQDPALRDNLREYINSGGKLYITDYAYDLLEQSWPTYVNFGAPEGGDGDADGHIGERDFMNRAAVGTLMYESEGRAHPTDLAQWLALVGASQTGKIATEGNWVNLDGVGSGTQCCDEGGDPVTVEPETVISGPNGVEPPFSDFGPSHETWDEAEADGANRPHTLRFPYGCGQVMYSTYHTVDFQNRQPSLAPQELVLLWLILEIGECNLHPIKAPEDD